MTTGDYQLEARKRKAFEKRYKKAICKDINLESINTFLYEAQEACGEFGYYAQNEDVFVDALGGDEDEAFEYRVAFETLNGDLDQFARDLEEHWIPECFDDFFVSVGGGGDGMLGYDEYQGDYFGLGDSYVEELAAEESQKRMERLTKKDLFQAAGVCLRVATAYLGLKYRMEDLQAALDILRGVNNGLMEELKRLEVLYDELEKEKFMRSSDAYREFERIIKDLPEECWLR